MDVICEVRVLDCDGQLSIEGNRGLKFRLKRDDSTEEGKTNCCSCFRKQRRSIPFKISAADIVGAVRNDSDLEIWYMPQSQGEHGPRRRLMVTPTISLGSEAEAQQAQRALRALGWGGRSEPPRFAVVINPASGSHRGRKVWEEIEPLFRSAAGAACSVRESSRRGGIGEIVRGLDPRGVDAIVLVGGDGTVHEAVQGLLDRPDWEAAAAVPLVQVPAGSGNALCASLRLTGAWHAAYAALKGNTRPMDAATVLAPNQPRRFSFLSLTTGLLANLDIGTEHLRWMGELRFTLGGLYEILAARTNRTRVTFLPLESAGRVQAAPAEAIGATSGGLEGPPCPVLQQLGRSYDTSDASFFSRVHDGPPAGWQQLPDEPLQLIVAANMPWLATSSHVLPTAELSDGAYTLMWTTKASRLQGLDCMAKMEKGEHTNLPFVHTAKVAAMIFEPLDVKASLVCDGEPLVCCPTYLEIHRGLLTVLNDPHVNQPSNE
mmetsp:Transcript_10212/g.24358  ORF Transcript_10212/g.24358 Transcript_10212/m.24358 type:complete len:489 (+) Transcript_10212:129-1595(+)